METIQPPERHLRRQERRHLRGGLGIRCRRQWPKPHREARHSCRSHQRWESDRVDSGSGGGRDEYERRRGCRGRCGGEYLWRGGWIEVTEEVCEVRSFRFFRSTLNMLISEC